LRQLAWAASHDLQEPIRTVVTYSQWLSQSTGSSLGTREAKMLATIEQHATRLNLLLTGLRQYIQVSDSGQLTRTPVDCNAVVKAAALNLQSIIQESGASIECVPLPTISSIELPLVQLFQNLMGNAIKYRSADRRFSTRSARRSVETNFPVSSTVKSFHCPTTTAALPSPKWARSTRPAVASQSGTDSARRFDRSARPGNSNRPRHAAVASLLAAQKYDFLVTFSDVIEKFSSAQIFNVGL
jgi:hypothetical protein